MLIEFNEGELVMPAALAQQLVNALQLVTGKSWAEMNTLIQGLMAADKDTQARKAAANQPKGVPCQPRVLDEKVPDGL